jgi:hypothetical protein
MPDDTMPDDTLMPFEHYGLPVYRRDDGEYAVAATDALADHAARLAIAESLWAFNTAFLAGFIPALRHRAAAAAFDKMREARCEDATELVSTMLGDNLSRFVAAAIAADGRGHFLSPYDGEEIEGDDGSYSYRIN